MPEPNELDTILTELAAAQQAGQPEDELAAIRRRIPAAANREAQTRQEQNEKEKRKRFPHAEVGPYQPNYVPTPKITELLTRLRQELLTSEFAPHADDICARAEPCINLTIAAVSGDLPLGASRFGYVPDLPIGVAWPTHRGRKLLHLAQVDCSQLPHWQGSPLPERGWLYFFAHLPIRITPEDPWTYAVLYHDGPREGLVRQPKPADDTEIWRDWAGGDELLYLLVPVAPEVAIDVDEQLLDPVLRWPAQAGLDEIIERICPDVADSYGDTRYAGYLLGKVYSLAGTATTNVNQMIEYGHLHPRAAGIARAPGGPGNDWMHLLTLRSVGSMQWSDCGILYFLIRRADLQARDFSRVLMSMWSS